MDRPAWLALAAAVLLGTGCRSMLPEKWVGFKDRYGNWTSKDKQLKQLAMARANGDLSEEEYAQLKFKAENGTLHRPDPAPAYRGRRYRHGYYSPYRRFGRW
jgi:hypothetical protein